MKQYIKVRNNILDEIKNSVYYLKNIGYVSEKTYKHIFRKKLITKCDISRILYEFDNKYYIPQTFSFREANDKIITYGKSQMNNDLEAYVINDNENVTRTILITTELHGYEGRCPMDGIYLTTTMQKVANYYVSNEEKLGNTRLVIAHRCNPDGLIAGNSKKGFGRNTYNNVDINRDFMDYEFKALETIAIKELMDKYKPDICVDIHGWLNSMYGDSEIMEPFYRNALVERKYPNQYGINKGYLIGYAHEHNGCKCALIEFTNPSTLSEGRVIASINELIFGTDYIDPELYHAKIISEKYCELLNHDKDAVKKLLRRG